MPNPVSSSGPSPATRSAEAFGAPAGVGPDSEAAEASAPAPAKVRPARKIVVRRSQVHGRGVYAARALAKGERVIEYKGELITWKEADRRPPSDPDDPHHTFFFSLSDGRHVIDANSGGNAARWINHACAPNCETEESDDGRVFIHALRRIREGEELNYDYGLIIDEKITGKLRRQYACRCGARDCRGTMLALKSAGEGKDSKKKDKRAKAAGKDEGGKNASGKKAAGKQATGEKATGKKAGEKKGSDKKGKSRRKD